MVYEGAVGRRRGIGERRTIPWRGVDFGVCLAFVIFLSKWEGVGKIQVVIIYIRLFEGFYQFLAG